MHDISFIQDLTIVLLVAGLVTLIFRRLKQPVVLGYLIAGLIVGPHTPPFQWIHDKENIDTLAQLGIIFLMFSLGLHFSFRKLRAVGATALIAALLEILLMLWIGFEVGRFFGWSQMDSLFLGAILSISSTTIIVKALGDLGLIQEKFSHLIFGILIVEDILAVALLALLSSIALTGAMQVGDVMKTLGRLGLFLTIVLSVGLILVPAVVHYVKKFNSHEMTLIVSLGICFGMSILAVKMGYSEALGAFLGGALLAETQDHHLIETLIEPLRDMFSAIFFVSVGLLIDPQLLVAYATPILLITCVVVLGKILTCSLGTFIAGNDARTSLKVGMGLAQIGEFSFIIAGLGLSLGVTSAFLYPIAVMVSAITTLLTPYLIRASDPLTGFLEKHAPKGLTSWLRIYHNRIEQFRKRGPSSVLSHHLKRGLIVVTINVIVISGFFIVADYVADHITHWWSGTLPFNVKPGALAWFIAMLLSLPLLVATFRKTHSVGMLIGEACLGSNESKSGLRILCTVIANTLVLVTMGGIGIWIAYLSAAFYPRRAALIGMSVLLGLILIIFWRLFIRWYSKLQAALEHNFSEP